MLHQFVMEAIREKLEASLKIFRQTVDEIIRQTASSSQGNSKNQPAHEFEQIEGP